MDDERRRKPLSLRATDRDLQRIEQARERANASRKAQPGLVPLEPLTKHAMALIALRIGLDMLELEKPER